MCRCQTSREPVRGRGPPRHRGPMCPRRRMRRPRLLARLARLCPPTQDTCSLGTHSFNLPRPPYLPARQRVGTGSRGGDHTPRAERHRLPLRADCVRIVVKRARMPWQNSHCAGGSVRKGAHQLGTPLRACATSSAMCEHLPPLPAAPTATARPNCTVVSPARITHRGPQRASSLCATLTTRAAASSTSPTSDSVCTRPA